MIAQFVLGNILVVITLAFASVARKWHRDLNELQLARVRLRLEAGDVVEVGRWVGRAARRPRVQAELIAFLPQISPAEHLLLCQAAQRAGLPDRLRAQLSARRADRRALAVRMLGCFRRPSDLPAVAACLADADADVRLVAADAVAAFESDIAASLLLDALARGLLPAERIVERLSGPWAVASTLTALTEGSAPPAHLARALGLTGDRRAAPALASLAHHGDPEVRIAAARALGTCGDQGSAIVLRAALHDEVWAVRAQAATALGRLRAVEAAADLEAAMTDEAWWVRANAASALAHLGPAGTDALRRVVASPDRYARDRAREALALTGLTTVAA